MTIGDRSTPLTVQGGDSRQPGRDKYRFERTASADRIGTRPPTRHAIGTRCSGDPDLPARLDGAHPRVHQLPVPGLTFDVPSFPRGPTATPFPKSSIVATSMRAELEQPLTCVFAGQGLFLKVPRAGLEPARPFEQSILSAPCLPFHHPGEVAALSIPAGGPPPCLTGLRSIRYWVSPCCRP